MKKSFILSFTFFAFFACTEKKANLEETPQELIETDSTVKTVNRPVKSGEKDPDFERILDSVYVSWQVLLQEENQRLQDIELLLKEVSYFPTHVSSELQKKRELAAQLKAYVYSQYDIPEFDILIQNDEKTEAIIEEIIRFAEEAVAQENKDYPLITQLKADIRKSLDATALLSSKYSSHAVDQNNYVKQHKNRLEKMGYTHLEELKTFFATAV